MTAAIAWALANWRGLLAGLAFSLLVAGGAALYGKLADLRVEAAEARAARAEDQRADAERRAGANAAAAIELARTRVAELAALEDIAAAQQQRMNNLAEDLEAIRSDPSRDLAAAPVLELSLDRLRARRAARAGDPDHPGERAGGAAALPAAPAAASPGDAPDAGPRGGAAAGAGGGAR